MIVVPGYTTTGGQGAWPLYLYRGQGQVNTRRDQPGVGGQQLHDLGSCRSLTRVSTPAGGQQRTPEEKMLFSSTKTGHRGLQLGAQTNRLGQSLAFLHILHHLVVGQTLVRKGAEGDDLVK